MQTKTKLVLIGLVTAAWVAAVAAPAHATIWTLTHRNSTVEIDDSSQDGMYSWQVDGTDHLFQQWFWFRVGPTGGETSIDSLSVSGDLFADRFLSLTYTDTEFEILLQLSLLGGLPGSDRSDFAEQISIDNTGSRTLDFHFFQYADFDIGGFLGDTVQFVSPNGMRQWDPAFILSESIVGPPASRYQVGPFPSLLNQLNSGGPTNLNNNGGPFTGDATWAFQWDFTLAPGDSFVISKDKQLRPIPEPASLILVGAGLLGLALRRRH